MLAFLIVGAASLIVGALVGIATGLWLRRFDFDCGYLIGYRRGAKDWSSAPEEVA